ncbi:hypothetical protein E1A91_A01G206700v1 [Gossypium mustelinum]|uniref:non-specific serine/threonine protein kinase n=1 Tax=Gossypium mustelinum TaxID=34275 RepID=A0A5D3AJ65_GOSMU|nr:hypothetical protein E1A91_A01G206700v1 [Gossypium mustelinum]
MSSSPLPPYLLILLVFLIHCSIQVSCFRFNFPAFEIDHIKQLILSNSYIVAHALQVTPDLGRSSIKYTSGRAVYKKPFRLWKDSHTIASFNTTFVFVIQNRTSPGGEGLAFIIAGDSTLPPNSEGRWLGILNSDPNGSQVVAVEFDTRKSDDQDLDDNHIGLDINSINHFGFNISGGRDLWVLLQYDGQNLTVRVNETHVLSQRLDLSSYLPKKVFVGFSASTSNETQLNCIKSWEFFGTDIGGEGNLLWVAWIMIPVVILVLFIGVRFYLYRRTGPVEEDFEDAQRNIEDEIRRSDFAPKKFRFSELKQATGNFSPNNKLGKGGFGTVYKGSWGNKDVAVKRVSKKSNQGKQEFMAEVTTIGNLNHKNLVKLIGWCYERRELLLVYEYMPNGSLDKFIFYDEKTSMVESRLNWEQRQNIIRGVAQALEYLHNGCQKRVLHHDIKASNIMLDSEFIAKLGDFGLARTIHEKEKAYYSTVEIAGTPGYMAPETFLISRATVETDVYSFGVLILEVVCGRKPGNKSEQNNSNNSIVNWLWEYYENGKITATVDSRMDGNFVENEAKRVLILGLACCHPNPHCRPCMRTVLQVLLGEIDPPEVPQERPSFVWPAMPPSFTQMDHSLKGSQLNPITELAGR